MNLPKIILPVAALCISFFNNVDLMGMTEKEIFDDRLFVAVSDGDAKKVATLLGQGADIESSNLMGYTPLIWAARKGDSDLVELLLTHNAKTTATTYDGTTALLHAVHCNHYDTVEILLKNGADVNHKDAFKCTALTYARIYDDQKLVSLLLLHKGIDTPDAEKILTLFGQRFQKFGDEKIWEFLNNSEEEEFFKDYFLCHISAVYSLFEAGKKLRLIDQAKVRAQCNCSMM